jgi:hypothetical protein
MIPSSFRLTPPVAACGQAQTWGPAELLFALNLSQRKFSDFSFFQTTTGPFFFKEIIDIIIFLNSNCPASARPFHLPADAPGPEGQHLADAVKDRQRSRTPSHSSGSCRQ